jgi:hypothetical protein
MKMVRKPRYFLFNVLIPIYLLALGVCFSFLIPAKSGERIGYIITIQLAIIFLSGLISANASPPSGDADLPLITS